MAQRIGMNPWVAMWIVLTVNFNVICAEDGGFGSDAVIGIVVASVCVLLIIIGAVMAYIICRMRRQAAKNPTDPIPPPESHTGQALPADIPIEAVTRAPPPAYAPPPRQSRTQRQPRPAVRSSGTAAHTTGVSSPPPPYAAAVSGAAIATIDMSCAGDAPPEYRSRVGLNSSVGNIEQLNSPRAISIGSFTEYPSMRNIVETSSRSSLQGTDSRHASQSDRSSAGPSSRAGGGADSARGDSVESRSNRSDEASNLRHDHHRAISSSSTALYDPRLSIPEGGLQRRVRRTKQQQQQSIGNDRSSTSQMNAEMNRSCPSLVSDENTDNGSRCGNGEERHAVPVQQRGHRQQRAMDAHSASSSTSAAAIQKRRRYSRKDGSSKDQRLSTSTEYSGDLKNQLQFSGRGHASYGTDTSASSLPSLSLPVTRFKVAGTCDV